MHVIRAVLRRPFIALVLLYVCLLLIADHCGFFAVPAPAVPFDESGETATFEGTLLAPPQAAGHRLSFPLALTSSGMRCIVFYRPADPDATVPAAGDVVRIEGELRPPASAANPGEFDYARYLAREGVTALLQAHSVRKVAEKPLPPYRMLALALRQDIVNTFQRYLPGEEGAVLAPMLVGDTSGLSRDLRTGFSDAGVMHVLVVSGMNVAYVAGLFLFLFRLLGLPRRPAALATIPCILLYIIVTGMNPPVVRAGVMALFVILSLSLRREPLIYQSLSLAAFVILLFDPQALFSASFQLSFAATLGIVSLSPLLLRPFAPLPGWLRWSLGGLVSVSLAAQLAVLPLLAFYFNKLSLVGLLSNLCIVPLTCLITIAGMLLYAAHLISASLAGAIACGAGWLLHLLLLLVRYFAALPHATLHVATPSLFTIGAYYLLLFSLPHLGRHRALRLTCTVIAAAWIAAFLWQRHDENQRVEITFLSVGNGDAVHIAFPGDRHWLIDGGGPAAGERLLCPYLWSRGISRLETVVVTHPHSPHYGGLPAVLRNFSVGQVLFCPAVSGEREFGRLLALVQEKGIPWKEAWAPDTFSVGGASVTVLSPQRLGTTPDDNALALLAAFEGQRVLLTSDMGAEAEARLTSSGAVQAELLQLPNHGNRALSQGFLKAVSPRCCIVSTRRARSSGSPCPVPLYSTRSSGAVTVELRRGKWLIREYRSSAGK